VRASIKKALSHQRRSFARTFTQGMETARFCNFYVQANVDYNPTEIENGICESCHGQSYDGLDAAMVVVRSFIAP
jgi:hypothetical protein